MGAAASFLPSWLYSQVLYRPKYPKGDLSNQTIIVTGSNVGLGFDAAQHFARLGASTVILAVRSEAKGNAAKRKIVRTLGIDESRIEVWPLDQSSTASITAFADRASRLERLDAVIENAGVLTAEWQTIEGVECQVKVNVLGTVMLALLLLPKLRETGKLYNKDSHLTLVGTDLSMIAAFREKDVDGGKLLDVFHSKEGMNSYDRYPATKVLMMLACQELAEQQPIDTSRVIINYCSPGACRTTIFRDDVNWFMRKSINVSMLFVGRSSEHGSRILVNSVTRNGRESHGKYVADDSSKAAPYVGNEWGKHLQARFWEELSSRLEEASPGITKK
ncbi:MAG: hypothetical protein M1820_006361 [Bogoriella megaspora]|nr:MAG: hypothetical protein M1820_006361 [Bogoriella megaspora]